jgi:hypothetical protein
MRIKRQVQAVALLASIAVAAGPSPALATGAHHHALVLRRDGSKAVPVALTTGAHHHALVLRRDGSKAVPVAVTARPAARAGGVDWGDAGMAAGAAAVAFLLAAAGAGAVHSRHLPRRPRVVPWEPGEK